MESFYFNTHTVTHMYIHNILIKNHFSHAPPPPPPHTHIRSQTGLKVQLRYPLSNYVVGSSLCKIEQGKETKSNTAWWSKVLLWADITKVIDALHIRNHRDATCQEMYSFKQIKSEHPNLNTMSCEQTFAWLSRYKKILCSMPKTHFHFIHME